MRDIVPNGGALSTYRPKIKKAANAALYGVCRLITEYCPIVLMFYFKKHKKACILIEDVL